MLKPFGSTDDTLSPEKKSPEKANSESSSPEVFSMNHSDSDDSCPDLDANKGPPLPMSVEEVISDEMTLEDMAKGISRLIMTSAQEAAVRVARKSTRSNRPRGVSFRERQASIIEIAGNPEKKPVGPPVHGW